MRPTITQLYNNALVFVKALEAAGVENAHAKVMGLMRMVCEYESMVKYMTRIDADRTYTHQWRQRREKTPGFTPDPAQRRRDCKTIAECNKTLIPARSYVRRQEIRLNARIAKWPDLDVDVTKLCKKTDNKMVNALLKKRRTRGRGRTIVLG